MSTDAPTLRDYQIEHLGFHIAAKKSLNTSHPGTGKTPTVCVLSWFHWERRQKKTVWAMPLSLMKKNRGEMVKFTEFAEDDVVILESDHAPLTKSWTGPTIVRQKKIRSLAVRIADARASGVTVRRTHTYALEKQGITPIERVELQGPVQPGCQPPHAYRVGKALVDPAVYDPTTSVIVTAVLGPSGAPQYEKNVTEDEEAIDLIAAAADAKVFIVSFAFLRSHWQRLLDTHPDIDLFLVDELHLGYKRPESEQTQSFYYINQHCENFVGMTGSLVDGQLDSAFPAIHVIEPRYYGSHAGFLNEHAGFMDNYGRVLVWNNEDKVRQILERHSRQVTFEQAYGKEDVVFFHELVEVGPKCRAQYDLFHEQAMLELENMEVLDGTLPGVAVIRARQILGHPETMGIAKGEETGKDQRLRIYAAEGQPMLIFAALKPEQRRIVKLMQDCGLRTGLINSDVSFNKRNEIDQAFRNGQLDVIVASGPTAGVGYNWERADHVIYPSVDYQDVNYIQAYRRASRGTRTKTLRVTSLEYEDTIDRRQYEILAHKSQLANKVDPTRPVLQFAA